jgi:S-adenosylmethionine:tRNA ribosyltransferase-isomerase
MDVSQFDFELPERCIALRPSVPRDSARLLVLYSDGAREDRQVHDLPQLLKAGDCLVFNNSKVLPVQLGGVRGAARVGVTLVERVGDNRWWAFVKNAKRIKLGDTVTFADDVQARAEQRDDDGRILWQFLQDAPIEAQLDRIGAMPLPPYIASKRAADAQDVQDYQTIFAAHDGSVAAPTAGLHFTASVFGALEQAGIDCAFVTLHVGPGTFLPVKVDDTRDHVMHSEWADMDSATAAQLNAVRARGGRIVAVGTTALRVLESVADDAGLFAAFAAPTRIFITPGYHFKAVDGLMTNFHLPRSTLFMLVSALAGLSRMRSVYEHAISSGYRFYSYGDSSLLWRPFGASI